MQINDIFRLDESYEQYAIFSNENKLKIVEIEPDEEGRRFQLQEIPPLTDAEQLDILRQRREEECFVYVNRSALWLNTLTEEQRLELDAWYKEWLAVTDKYVSGMTQDQIDGIIPIKPIWLK